MGLRTWLQTPRFRGAIIGLACAAICCVINTWAIIQTLENWALDACFLARGARDTSAQIVIVSVDDEATTGQVSRPLVLTSPELARAVEYLTAARASAIGLDLIADDRTTPRALRTTAFKLGDAITDSRKAVLSRVVVPNQHDMEPLYDWEPSPEACWNEIAAVNLTIDPADGFPRRQRLLYLSLSPMDVLEDPLEGPAEEELDELSGTVPEEKLLPCFGLAVLATTRIERVSEESPDGRVDLDDWWDNLAGTDDQEGSGIVELDGVPVPVDDDELLINYVGPPGTFETVTLADVLAAADFTTAEGVKIKGLRTFPEGFWEDKIVLVGLAGETHEDRHQTPYSNRTVARFFGYLGGAEAAGLMSGVEVHANTIATLYDGAYITTPVVFATPILLFATGIAMGILLASVGLEAGFLVTILHHLAWKLFVIGAFVFLDWRIEMVAMLLLGGLVFTGTFLVRWRVIRRMLGMVKSEKVAIALVTDPSKLDLKGEEREVTILFSDVRNFTGFSAGRSPQEVVRLLNEYFSTVVPPIESGGGIVNQYLGDGLMVLFGAPEDQPDHASRALRAGIRLVQDVHRNQSRWRELGAESFRIGVGINTGTVVVGTIGSPDRLDYTAIGDAVNTAARIESANKDVKPPSELLISESTFQALPVEEQQLISKISTPVEPDMKGITKAIRVYPIDVTILDAETLQVRTAQESQAPA